jgi:hypothetical protein
MTTKLLLILAMLQVPAFSPNGTGLITGQIRGADGMPLAGVSVLVVVGTFKDGKTTIVPLGVSIANALAKTDSSGHYHLENIPPGR